MTKHVFITYSHDDPKLFREFKTVLAPLDRQGVLKIVTDQELLPGDDWEQRIRDEMARCDFAVAFVTPAFLDSQFVQETEMPYLLRRHQSGEIKVLPFFIKATSKYARTFKVRGDDGKDHVFDLNRIQGLNQPNHTVASLEGEPRNQAFADAADKLVQLAYEAEAKTRSQRGDSFERAPQATPVPERSAPASDTPSRAEVAPQVAAPEPERDTPESRDRPAADAPPDRRSPTASGETTSALWRHRGTFVVLGIGLIGTAAGYFWNEHAERSRVRARQASSLFVRFLGEGAAKAGRPGRDIANLLTQCALPFQFGPDKTLADGGQFEQYFQELFAIARGQKPRPTPNGVSETFLKAIALIEGCGKILDNDQPLAEMLDIGIEIDPKDRNKSGDPRFNAPRGVEYYVLATLKVRGVRGHRHALMYMVDDGSQAKIVAVKLE